MSAISINLTPKLYQYLQNVSLREPKALVSLRDETAKLKESVMQISPEQGQFMRLLIELLNAKKTLDIGTFTGYSALTVALALPADGEVITCDINTPTSEIAKTYWQKAGVAQKIKLHLGPAVDTLQQLIDQGQAGTFDFAFIDADKNNYPDYFEKCLTLLRVGGLIAVDNVLWNGQVVDETAQDKQTQTIRELNARLHKDERVTISMIPIGDGLTLARKR